MAKGKYKKRRDFIKSNGNELYFVLNKDFNEKVINEIRKYDENGKVENEYKKLIDEIKFNEDAFFNKYKNTIANHIIAKIMVSSILFKFDKLKEQTGKTRSQICKDIGLNDSKVKSTLSQSIYIYPSYNALVFSRQVKNVLDSYLLNKGVSFGFALHIPIDRLVKLSFERFYRVSSPLIRKKAQERRLEVEEKKIVRTGNVQDIEFLRIKAKTLLDGAKTVEDFIKMSERIKAIGMALKGEHDGNAL